jgi:hypothetical protein
MWVTPRQSVTDSGAGAPLRYGVAPRLSVTATRFSDMSVACTNRKVSRSLLVPFDQHFERNRFPVERKTVIRQSYNVIGAIGRDTSRKGLSPCFPKRRHRCTAWSSLSERAVRSPERRIQSLPCKTRATLNLIGTCSRDTRSHGSGEIETGGVGADGAGGSEVASSGGAGEYVEFTCRGFLQRRSGRHRGSRRSAGVAWNHRFGGSSILARWLAPAFNNGLGPDTTEGAINLAYDLPNMHVEYLRVEPPGHPDHTFWRSPGPSHNVFVTESFMDELAAAAKQDPVAYRRALLDKSSRAKAVLELAAEKAGWGQSLPERVGRGVSLQFVFGTYMAQVAEVEVSKNGAVRVRRVVCAVDCGTVVNPDTVEAQIQGAIIFGITAALYGEITLKDGRVQQTNFDTYQMLRMNEAPVIEVHIVQNSEPPGGMGEPGTSAIVPAVTNAIFAATGKRLRILPIDTNLLKFPS